MEQEYLKVREVATMLKVSKSTVYNWIRDGVLKPELAQRGITRITKQQVLEFAGNKDEQY